MKVKAVAGILALLVTAALAAAENSDSFVSLFDGFHANAVHQLAGADLELIDLDLAVLVHHDDHRNARRLKQ